MENECNDDFDLGEVCCPDRKSEWWTDLDTDIVYCAKSNGCSWPRDIYEDEPEFKRRAALHPEVIPIFRELQFLEKRDRHLRHQLAVTAEQRTKLLEKLQDAHWLFSNS